ncbi:Lrp/AsnC family transcriptional regulator [Vibrio mediterranei]
MDKLNDRILQELGKSGRITNAELAQKVGLSPSACLRRVQDLESKRIIKGYRATIDYSLLGRSFVAYVTVGLDSHTSRAQRDFENAISVVDEIVECHNLTGEFEYLLRVETSDLKSYKAFHANTIGKLPHISKITTHVVMDSPKDERA